MLGGVVGGVGRGGGGGGGGDGGYCAIRLVKNSYEAV